MNFKCGHPKTSENSHSNGNGKVRCAICNRSSVARYRKENHPLVLKKQREWRKTNPDSKKEQNKKWIESHYQEHLEYNRNWWRNNLEKQREYRRSNSTKLQIKNAKRRARKAGVEVEEYGGLSYIFERDNGLCGYCGIEVKKNTKGPKMATRDHVAPISLGGPDVEWNIILSCKSCNSSKGVNNAFEGISS